MAETNPNQPLGNWHYEWREVSNPYADFNQTKLYELIANLFSQKGHTHQKSDITDFAHTHTGWTTAISITSGDDSGTKLFVNSDIRCAELLYHHTNTSVTTSAVALSTFNDIANTYTPKNTIYSTAYRPDITLSLATNGKVSIRGLTSLSSVEVKGSFFYHY